jgi:nucleoside 2-deoxyribosyltransferase
MTKVYLDSTLRHDWNTKFNPELCAKIEDKGVECYLPQRNTNQAGEPDDKFNQNIAGIKEADVLLAVASNESPNWGVEVGFAYGIKKKLIALCAKGHPVPLMAQYMFDEIVEVEDLDDIESYIIRLITALSKKRSL